MKAGSKRGVALAYVIVITAVLLILAAALVSVAKFNLDSSQNSLESRQAYLDAKSAIEYGRSYLALNPDKADESFSILRSGSSTDTGFKIGAANAANAVALYDSDNKAINAAAKYKSSDRVRRLGYQFDTEQGGSSLSVSNFMVLGYYGATTIVPQNYSPEFSGQKATSNYPVIFNRSVHIESATSNLTAPAVYLLEQQPWSFYGDWNAVMEMYTPFLYIAGNFYSQPSSNFPDSTQLMVYGQDSTTPCFAYFQNDCKIYNNNGGTLRATISSGLYKIKPGINIFKINEIPNDPNNKENCLIKATDSEIETYQRYIDYGNNANSERLYSSEPYDKWRGVQWTDKGALKSGICSIDVGSGNYSWAFNQECSGFEKQVYLYVNDCTGWGDANNIWRQNIARYVAREIAMRYVNSVNFVIPANKTVIFQADKISLSTEYKDNAIGEGNSRPRITHDGSAARFILQAQNVNNNVELYVPNAITVQYQNSTGSTKSYTIQSGYYGVKQLNLLSDDAKEFFANNPPDGDPDGGSGGGGSGDILTGGVYTNG